MKRGEHIRNWRQRYFVLFKDGSLLGFKTKVDSYNDPLNDFTVKDVQVCITFSFCYYKTKLCLINNKKFIKKQWF